MAFRSVSRRLVLLVAALLVACGPASSSTPTSATASHIRFQFFGDAEERAIYDQIAQAYMATHPGRVVELANVPAQGDHMARLAAAFAAGDPPEVFLVNYRRYGQFARSGVLEPVGPWMARSGVDEALYYPVALEAFRAGGQLQCLPQNLSSLVVYYNKDLFIDQGVPLPQAGWSWEEFVQAALRLTLDTDGDQRPDIYRLGVEPELIRLAPFIWQNSGDLVDDPARPMRFTLDAPDAYEAILFVLGLRANYGVTPSEAEAKAEDHETRFRNGKLAMVLNSRRVVPIFRTIADFTWDVAPLPIGRTEATVLDSDAYCITAAAADKRAAWDFVQYAAGPEGQRRPAELGRIVPSLKAVAESASFLDPGRAPASSQVFLDVIPSIRPLPIVPAWPIDVLLGCRSATAIQCASAGRKERVMRAKRTKEATGYKRIRSPWPAS
jgi:multiple sugar transport system substrate-binding protein